MFQPRHSPLWGILGIVLLSLLMANIASGQPDPDDSLSAVIAVSKANIDFSRDLYQVLRRQTPGNMICSPLSLSAVIAMVKGGARGVTADAIKSTLHFPEDPILFSGYKSLLKALKSNENFTLEIANRVYAKTGFEMNPDYVKIITDDFHAEVEQIDFSQPQNAANKINAWVEAVTRNKITKLISSGDLDALTRLVLVNGIYFKGKWKTEFKKELTKKDKFYTDSSSSIDVDMMNIETDLPFAEITELEARAVSLPYQGNRLSLIVLLPNAKDGLKNMENLLKDFELSSLLGRLRKKKIALQMPKFKLESTLQLKDPLTQLGLGSMFDQRANFSGIPKNPSQDSLYVSKVIQKAFIEVNEEGSEAAAASGRGSAMLLQTQSQQMMSKSYTPVAAERGGSGHGGGHGGGHSGSHGGGGHSSSGRSHGGFTSVGHTGGGNNMHNGADPPLAGAGGGIQITLKSAIVPSVRPFVVDHSFVVFIHDMETGIPIFMTTVVNPLNEQTELRTAQISEETHNGDSGDAVIQKMQWGLVSLGFLYTLQRAL